MDEKRKLKVLEKTEVEQVSELALEQSTKKIEHPNQTNPIYKKLMTFKNSQIGNNKLSVEDLLR